jgi:hypothetical protein
MLRKLHIARGEVDLGILTEAETIELLHAGYLLPSDLFWTEGMKDWKLLAEFKLGAEEKTSPAALMKLAKQKVKSAGEVAVSQAARLTSRLKSVTGAGRSRWTVPANQMLEAFTPQIQKLVSSQLMKHSVARVQAAIHDDEFMRKLFGATYDFLPKPVYRFVKEEAFIQFCMERRQKLLAPSPAEKQDN